MTDCPHGLDTEWCQLCKEPARGRSQRSLGAADGPRVKARHDGRCPSCGDRLHADEDFITLVEGEWVCDNCT